MHPRFAPYLFGLILSGMMSFLVSGFATWRATGLTPDFMHVWLSSWVMAWAIAYPALLAFSPFVRRLVARLVRDQTQ